MKLSAYIEMLQRKQAEIGQDIEVAFTQAGYYSDGPLADLYENPEIREIFINTGGWSSPDITEKYLVLGHSIQSY